MSENIPTRRNFLKASGATAGVAAGLTTLGSTFAATSKVEAGNVHSGGNETLRVGLVGCGGRGTGAALDALSADPHAKLVALGDTFRDRAETCLSDLREDEELGSRVLVDEEHIFDGFDNYRHVIDACDVVLLTTPTHFRPQHLAYAVQQGKHSFVEKPIAVDAPGVRSVMETCRLAKEKNLAVVSGLCWRYDLGVRETMRKILEEKAIGEIVSIESSYNSGQLWHRGNNPEWSQMEYQVRNWIYYTWLSGDHILEQAIHSLDKTAWLLGDIQPTQAMGLGGRQQRTDAKYGNVYDHFTVFYEYPTGQRVYFTCRQQDGTDTHVDETVLGTNGQAEILRNRLESKPIGSATGKKWRYRGPKPSMYRQEHKEMFESIRAGEPINNGHYMCNSTMIGVMGRMAAYSGKTVTWDECFNSEQRLGPTEFAWTDIPVQPVAIPGTKQVS
ncbi:Gfo/Idh/MocA family oxidoreductase [Adhaeretor mobilis]|uniref:Inositol 2-dehydrogenase n=1 Tax=Adhaeretor mobilis TaxID=1930276 RepID=A0A517MPX4_9BACT|nr:Gfo/Idh/MocA family oxidoreductase [Adhaeretor mobilis]QDS96924.1 Inositol 2-dehydrogenase [Adhaeretor mobilis]